MLGFISIQPRKQQKSSSDPSSSLSVLNLSLINTHSHGFYSLFGHALFTSMHRKGTITAVLWGHQGQLLVIFSMKYQRYSCRSTLSAGAWTDLVDSPTTSWIRSPKSSNLMVTPSTVVIIGVSLFIKAIWSFYFH